MATSERTAPAETAGLSGESWLALSALLAGAFLGTLDTTVVNIALNTIRDHFGVSVEQVQLVGSGYILAFAAALVLGGKLGDKFGRRAVFRTGVLLFLLFSIACALAPTLPALIALRVLQGLSAALMVPQVLAIIKASFRRKAEVATSLYGATLGMATISGMIVGGFLVGATGWRSVFVINIPICAFILAASRRGLVPESRGRVEGFDVLGPVLLASAMVTLLVPLSFPRLGSPGLLTALLVGLVALLVGLWRYERSLERRKRDTALIPPAMFARGSVGVGLAILGVYFVGTAGFNVVLAFHLQSGFGLSQLATGLLTAPLGIGFALGSATAHKAARRLGPTVIVVGCVGMVATRLLLIAAQDLPRTGALALTASLAGVTGVAQGVVVPPLMNVVLLSVATRFSGVASGMLLTICNCAMAAGQAVFLALYSGQGAHGDASTSFVSTLWSMTALATLTTLASASALRLFRRDQGVGNED
ncbi:MFS transporter [Streptomyces viridifaciens]|uniref:MFS transporter n=1 Tax=Kitasatospora aureofaciens TaxID=1894 RepID=UPI0009280D16|nr:MFS transporter [Streptomyces viridifaciens]UKZ05318.1 MFS transporter [Streptomyces viridifaciens]